MDILFKNEDWVFSYRVAGICVQNGKVLLQTTTGEDRSFAFPGGHVEFGETNEQTLLREFKEEIGADIRAGDLKWVAEVKSDEYYVNMMRAWYFATALAKQYDSAVRFIEEKKLDRWTHNKAIQKSVESYRITPEQKTYLKSLKIK